MRTHLKCSRNVNVTRFLTVITLPRPVHLTSDLLACYEVLRNEYRFGMSCRFLWAVLLTALLTPGHAFTGHATRVSFKSLPQNIANTPGFAIARRPHTQSYALATQQDEQDHAAQRARFSLRILYIGLTYLCIQMVLWMSLLPATWLVNRSPFHSRLTNMLIQYLDGTQNVASSKLSSKFIGRPLIQMTHMVPGAVWSAIIPFQLHPTFRMKHPKTHKLLGYVFLLSSVLCSVGVFIILGKGLLYENHLFPDLPPVQHYSKPVVIGASLWFSYTASRAWHAVFWRRNIEQHQTWIIRHVGAGVWISLGRFLMFTLNQMLFPAPTSRALQRSVFGDTWRGSLVVGVVVAEFALRLIRQAK